MNHYVISHKVNHTNVTSNEIKIKLRERPHSERTARSLNLTHTGAMDPYNYTIQ